MNIVIQKYGGTSVNSYELREKICENLRKAIDLGYKPIIVVSAMGRQGEPYSTDSLINLISRKKIKTREMDMIMSCGEIISSVVVAAHLKNRGFNTIPLTGGQAGIITDNNYGESNILEVDPTKLLDYIKNDKIPIVAGFQGVNKNNEITTIGRGGSDVTASILGNTLKAHEVQIFTDVDGIMTADPKIVDDAKVINNIDYDEVFQLAEYGAKVIHPRAVEIAMKGNIPIKVYNTRKFNIDSGTLISSYKLKSDNLLTAIAHENKKVQIKIYFDKKIGVNIFDKIAKAKISIDLINVFIDYSVFIIEEDKKEKIIKMLKNNNLRYEVIEQCTKITIVGSKMKGVPGVMAKLLSAIKGKVEVLQTSDSHTTISILVKTQDSKEAINLLHRSFEL